MAISLDRQQAIVWMDFLDTAYSMYVPGVTNPVQPPSFPAGWRLFKNIDAEAVVSFYRQKEFIGYIAQRIDEPRQFAVILHGTEGVADFLDDFEFVMSNFTMVPDGGKTEYGFTRFYESFSFVDPVSATSLSLSEYLAELHSTASFTVVGFSLGGALATLHAAVLASRRIPVEAYLFASPMVGNPAFVHTYNTLVPRTYRIVNKPDIVPKLPGTLLGYEHVNTVFEINSLDFPDLKHSITCFHSPQVYAYALGMKNADIQSCKG